MKKLLLFLFLIPFSNLVGQNLSIYVENNAGQTDSTIHLLLIHSSQFDQGQDLVSIDTLFIHLQSKIYFQNNLSGTLEPGISYSVLNDGQNFDLYLTELPILSILPVDSIVDEPKRHAELNYFDDELSLQTPIGIEIRGGSSQLFPKKTYDFEVRRNYNDDSIKDVQFGNLRSDDDWILDAVYNEPLRIRSRFSHQLWIDTHAPYYQAAVPSSQSGARTMPVEVFISNEYKGTYNLSEEIDRKLLQLKKYQSEMKGELYKSYLWGAPTFWQAIPYNNSSREWDGFEFKYPKTEELTDWSNIHSFTDFVINSSENEFDTQIWNQFNQQNAIDYYLFFNLLKATDNTAKNTYFAKQDEGEPYFYIPWDLDACFGNTWEGYRDSSAWGEIHNRCYTRLKESSVIQFHNKASLRWEQLRLDQFHKDSLYQNFCSLYNELNDNGNYLREALVFPNYDFDIEEKDFFSFWLNERLMFLDDYFSYIGIKEYETHTISVYPNPFARSIQIDWINGMDLKEYEIRSVLGELILSGKIHANESIDTEKLNAGVYLFILDNQTIKIIKK